MKELSKNYQAEDYEDKLYHVWEKAGYFKPSRKGKPFSIVLPPPNVTGRLHIGHAAMLAYQDIMIRYHRLLGDKTLWLPGMDHAAIATQNVVEKELKKQGKTRYDLGRDKFLKQVNSFADDSKVIIRSQIKKMGSSLDWSHERFTLDENLSVAVRTAFKKMYDDGLIYRGDRVVNWCQRCQSTLADDEVEHKEEKSQLYFINYGFITVATTRPETKLGDTAVAVNPKDARYKKLVGKTFKVDLAGHKISVQVFADREVEMDFGTGAIGVTPAHSQTDYAWAIKYNLPLIKVINEYGKMTESAGKYAGLTVKECREKFVADLEKVGLIKKVEQYNNNLSICYRCGTAIEPLTSKQWFVAVNKKIPSRNSTLKQLASEAVKSGKIKIIPDRFNKTYFQWMDNLKDWCISRQIWYGHRIPVWYNNDKIYVGLTAPKGVGWKQDEDTLDTWFSAGLWTFSTLGWPASVKTMEGRPVKISNLKAFYPISVMETGYDILFFWVARMIIMSTYLMKEIPFKTVYLHGLVRDKEGRKMSKSLGNGIDPLAMISKFGADSLRLSLIVGATPGNDIRLYEEKIAGYRNFVNKLWNISRFILMNIKEQLPIKAAKLTLADKWILDELNKIIKLTTQNIEQFKFSMAGEQLYEFTRAKLADVYLEITKVEGSSSSSERLNKQKILLEILEKLLILWHPFCPFVTEVIWQQLPVSFKGRKKGSIMQASWPKAGKSIISPAENKKFIAMLEAMVEARKAKQSQQVVLAPKQSSADLEKYIKLLKKKLANPEFISKAPQVVIQKENNKLAEAEDKFAKLS